MEGIDGVAGLGRVADTARRLLGEGPTCDHCLGRAFAHFSTGLSNAERGRALKMALAMAWHAAGGEPPEWLARSLDFLLAAKGERRGPCWLCGDLFGDVEAWALRCQRAAEGYEFSTYLVGTRLPGLLAEKEEIVVTEFGLEHSEPLKSEVNREVGKALGRLLAAAGQAAQVDLMRPELVFHLDLERGAVVLEVRSLFVAGRYRKLVRGIPQTHWDCRSCRGAGCERCGGTGKQYPESVEELIAPHFLAATGGAVGVLHGAGREDIDARMLGSGRPFVLEVRQPRRRTIDLEAVAAEVNRHAAGKVEVEALRAVDRDAVRAYKLEPRQKVYRIKAKYQGAASAEALKNALAELTGHLIEQETPQRVVHRRADKVRTRAVQGAVLVEHQPPHAVLEVTCDGGLYVKELVSGDEGRTRPSLSELLGMPVSVVELDVLEVKEANHGEVPRGT